MSPNPSPNVSPTAVEISFFLSLAAVLLPSLVGVAEEEGEEEVGTILGSDMLGGSV